MGTRKLRAKKYKSIYEFYSNTDPEKRTIAHEISYWVSDPSHKNGGVTKKERLKTLDPNVALAILNDRKEENSKKKKERHESGGNIGADLTIDRVASEYFFERKKTENKHKDMKRYILHVGGNVFQVHEAKNDKGYKLTDSPILYHTQNKDGSFKTHYYSRAEDNDSLNLGDTAVSDLTPNTLMRLIKALEGKGLSAKTIASVNNLLKAITNHAISEGYIVRNPFLNKKAKVNVPKEDRKRLFTPDERKEIFINAKKMDNRTFILFKMLYYTGQRPKSIIALRVRDIDLNKRQISIDAIKDQSGTFVPISDKLYPLLKLWIKDQDQNTPLFDIQYVTFSMKALKLFAKYNKGLDYKKHRYQWASMYSFRHTAATVMLAKTDNIKTVQTVMNHSDPKVTAIYAKLLDDAKRKGVNVL